MADLLRFRRAATDCVFWARELRRAALLLAASVALFWSSLATGRWIVPIPDSGPIFGDVLIVWLAVVVHVSAWPNLWAGLRDLRARQPNDPTVVVAWRAFLLTLVVVVAAIIVVLLEYHAIVSPEAGVVFLYLPGFSYPRRAVSPPPPPPRGPLCPVPGRAPPPVRCLAGAAAGV